MRPKLSVTLFVSLAALCFCTGHAAAQSVSAAPAAVTTVSANGTAAPGTDAPLPTATDILQKFEKAIGGREAWSGFTTRTMKGIYQPEDLSGFAGIEIIAKAPNKKFIKTTFPNGIALREICDGKSAWIEDPRGGMHEFTGAALESRLRLANFNNTGVGMLMMLTGRVIGTAQVGTHATYVMEFAAPDKKVTSKVYFDVESGFAVRAEDTIHREDGDYTVQTFMDDYRPVDGAYFPFRIRHVEKGNIFTVRITQIKNNSPVDDSVFLKTESANADR
jgi:outer membrane lipoprotein-sorting protein